MASMNAVHSFESATHALPSTLSSEWVVHSSGGFHSQSDRGRLLDRAFFSRSQHMVKGKTDHILIFSADATIAPSPEVRRGLREPVQTITTQTSEVAVRTLQENLRAFLHHIDAVIAESPKEVGGLALEEVELHVQIDGKGNVGLLGMAKAEIAAQGGIKLVLRKKR